MDMSSLFSLDVYVEAVHSKVGAQTPRQETIACRFLDYPTFFIHSSPEIRQYENFLASQRFCSGKSCLLAETKDQLAGLLAKVRPDFQQIHAIALAVGLVRRLV